MIKKLKRRLKQQINIRETEQGLELLNNIFSILPGKQAKSTRLIPPLWLNK